MSGRANHDNFHKAHPLPGSQYQPMPFEVLSGFTSYRVGKDSMRVYNHVCLLLEISSQLLFCS